MEREITTRADALATGRARYYTGEPCKHGHVAERNTMSGACVECAKANREREQDIYRTARQQQAKV